MVSFEGAEGNRFTLLTGILEVIPTSLGEIPAIQPQGLLAC